mmetsp:Transcript_9904/g.17535  ORF Transcript_9904/g.17535 Transcript_9904/m.17535 type:complete len:223 (+) Transcript_9904:71-739(+)
MISIPRTTSPVMSDTSVKRKSLLNKFLTKTYFMIDACPPDIGGWSHGGTSFQILDTNRFENECLPKYFNHNKWSSFVRQLNFYGFQKLRGEPDLQMHTSSVRFAHEYFRKGQPELLSKIKRSTSQKPDTIEGSQIETMQRQIEILQKQVRYLEKTMDEKVEQARMSVTQGYKAHIRNLEISYGSTLNAIAQHLSGNNIHNSLVSSPVDTSQLVSYIRSNQDT